ncbi:ATP-binding cassette domain-containing protein [Lentilactobacillus farraginis]|uniref:ABC transporter ATP-binding membrane spanning permease-possible multidrug resistance n=1 Tax=Lentilactobacillus farraginis DSM 18382 = JCM 14108 TaxID=1423743 RepID=X0PA99_9LACO|nr:ABC transporter ATP-binding protein [Lentilactobacillus farraginis]KRM01789.1 ABC transporter ATP-binding membrane spanning permease - possible multidrug resistance [Lentilactobacillus farraginis DSM 18382 = JCM 14108]GAF36173.1 ABC transporter related [Lentilactobacillus farraginis DSM 18382 = JCM 14108]
MKKYLGLHKREVGIIITLLAVTELFTVLGSVINARILNSLVAMKIRLFSFNVGLFLVNWAIIVAIRYLETIYQERVIQNMDTAIRSDVVGMLLKSNYSTYNSKDTNTYESWVNNDIQTINEQGFRSLFVVIDGLLGTFFALIVLFTFHWSLAIMAIAFSLVILTSPRFFNGQLEKQTTAFTHENERFVEQTGDFLSVFNLLYTFNALRLLLRKITQASQKLGDAFVNRSRVQAKIAATGFLGNVISQILLTGLTGFLVIDRLVSVGTINAVSSLSGNIFNNLGNMSNYLGMIRGTRPIFSKYGIEDRLIDQSNIKAKKLSGGELSESQTDKLIKLTDVSFGYEPKKPIFAQVSVSFKAGKKYLILGQSGSGKSTLLKVVAGYLLPESGTVLFKGRNLKLIDPEDLHRQLLYLDQKPQMISASVRENLNLGAHYSDEQLIKSLKYVELVKDERAGMVLLNTNLRDNQGLSGGQLQRLALARGILRRPKIILLDEGTSAVDHKTAVDIERLLLQDSALTLIMVSHTPHQETVGMFDQQINFDDLIKKQ